MLFLKAILLFLGTAVVNAGVVVKQAGPADHYHNVDPSTPQGENTTLGDLDVTTYVSLPKQDFEKDTAVVILMDIFGLAKVDNMLLADQWAAAGFATYMPDYLFGDPFPEDGSENIATWIGRHGEGATTPLLLSVLDALKTKGITKIATSGYCFGGLYATRLVQNNTVQVATMSHPSLLTVPDDYELVLAQSTVPVQINSAEFDTGLTPALAEQIDEVMVDYEPGYERNAFAGVGHGFAVSADPNDPNAVAAKQGAFDEGLDWITSHLAKN